MLELGGSPLPVQHAHTIRPSLGHQAPRQEASTTPIQEHVSYPAFSPVCSTLPGAFNLFSLSKNNMLERRSI